MRYNTGNPVGPDGSSSPFDLHDNSGNIDVWANNRLLEEFPDRLGIPRKTWYGMEKQVTDYLIAQGYESVYLNYAAGVIVERQTQLVQRSGELYRVMNAADIPLTLTGTWATDAPKLQAVGDAALRQALASSTGATMVHRGTSTVDADLAALEAGVAQLQSSASESARKLLSQSSKSYNSVNANLSSQNPWGVRCLNVFGDSISFGANANIIERDSYIGLLKKMLNIDLGSTNVGVLGILPRTSNEGGTYDQYFSTYTSQTGTWVSIAGAAAAHIPFGYALESSIPGSSQFYRAPISQRYVRLWFDGTVTGEIEIVMNNVVVQTLVTTGTGSGFDRGAALELGALQANNRGVALFIVRNKSGTIRLTGLEFTNETSGSSFRVQNFSRDGRAGQFVGQDVINRACAGCYAFIWALATNDITGYNAAAQAAYDQRIDWIIAAALANRTRVVFIDWLFQQPYTHGLRASLRRGAASIPGSILIEADQVWTISGAQYTEAERNGRGLSLGVHPEELGHQLMAETLAQRLGLAVNSKKQAIRRDPMWKALDMSATTLANTSTIPGRFTGYRITDRAIELVVNITTVPTVSTVLGTIPASDFPTGFPGLDVKTNPDPTGKTGIITVSAAGQVSYKPDPTMTAAPTTCSLYATIPYHDEQIWI
ncbi:hypothetical protein QU926_20910 [Pseudomonas asiatica]|uniref:hypothetical protein n=1 Tax=Pseudomonas asiatica TaxID=2219225 RepID=UPI0025AAB1BD|nr:hypothetical protein [Pseudomonas asiatica]MDM9556078.1 hypothetical protein [Pseudomonas asiatica]